MHAFIIEFTLFNRTENMKFRIENSSLMYALQRSLELLDKEHNIVSNNIDRVLIYKQGELK